MKLYPGEPLGSLIHSVQSLNQLFETSTLLGPALGLMKNHGSEPVSHFVSDDETLVTGQTVPFGLSAMRMPTILPAFLTLCFHYGSLPEDFDAPPLAGSETMDWVAPSNLDLFFTRMYR